MNGVAILAGVVTLLVGVGIGFVVAGRRVGANAGVGAGRGGGGGGGGRRRRDGQVAVPSSWARSHDPEARLHRRLRQVVTALGALPPDDVTSDVRAAVARAAAALDERLVAVAALPPRVKDEPLAHVTREVEGLEEAVADVTTRTAAGGDVGPALRALSDRLALLDAARAELDSLAPPPWPAPGPGAGGPTGPPEDGTP